VVLAHQIDDDQTDWFDFASVLRSRGYRALTFNFRGVCSSSPLSACSKGGVDPNESPSDVMGAVRFVRSQGAKAIFLIGASMGGEAVILAASKLGADVQGVISLSASKGLVGLLDPEVEDRMVASVGVPKLFVAGEMDQSFAAAARDFFAHAKQPKELRLFPLGDHGVALVHSAQGPQVQDLIFEFLTSNSPGG
jgi:pimeloyl-ACP methyl ester carboxylesterase